MALAASKCSEKGDEENKDCAEEEESFFTMSPYTWNLYHWNPYSWNPYNLKAAPRSSSHPFDDPTFNLVCLGGHHDQNFVLRCFVASR